MSVWRSEKWGDKIHYLVIWPPRALFCFLFIYFSFSHLSYRFPTTNHFSLFFYCLLFPLKKCLIFLSIFPWISTTISRYLYPVHTKTNNENKARKMTLLLTEQQLRAWLIIITNPIVVFGSKFKLCGNLYYFTYRFSFANRLFELLKSIGIW